jgi:cytochrome c-type biogenesis protein CcmH/NrfG
VKSKVHLSSIVFLAAFHISLAHGIAQRPLPPEGLKAEMAQEWHRAIDVYRDVLKQEPNRTELWLRISEIETHLGNLQEAIDSLKAAAQLEPGNAAVYYRLSQAYSAANKPGLAFSAVERSIALEPENSTYLEAYAQLANWIGKPGVAADTYEKLLSLAPDDRSTLLNVARSSLWSERLDKAASAYKSYLREYPENKEAYLEYARTELWRGNYGAAMDTLGKYREKFGESREYTLEKARVLTHARRPAKAMPLISRLLQDDPDSYELNQLRTLALHYARQRSDAAESLARLEELRPDAPETESTRSLVMDPLRPMVTFSSRFYTDSDELEHYTNSIRGGYSLSTEFRLDAGGEIDYIRAEEGSGLERIDRGDHASHRHAWLGMRHSFSPKTALHGYLGSAAAEDHEKTTYGIGVEHQPRDNLNLGLERHEGFYVISPRSVSLGIGRVRNSFRLDWQATLLHTAVLDLRYDTFSDTNTRWEAVLSPRRSILRSRKFNLDCGLRGWWFGFEKDVDNGYYDPLLYQSYMLTGLGFWKIDDHKGVSISLDVGVLKDSDMDGFRIGWGGSLEGTMELYRDIIFKVGGSAIKNFRQEAGAFRAYAAHIKVIIRL